MTDLIKGKLVYEGCVICTGEFMIGDDEYNFIDVHNVLAHDDGKAEQRAEYICNAVNEYEQLKQKNKQLLETLCDIQNMCIGDLTMGYKLDADYVGCLISKSTSMTHPELRKYLKEVDDVNTNTSNPC